MAGGLGAFSQWFTDLLKLPFEDLELKLIRLFVNLLEYNEICEDLFENQETTRYLLRPVAKGNSTKVLRGEKNRLVSQLIEKSNKEWKNTKLGTYGIMIEKELQKEKMQMEVAMESA